jgi:hypothetical protein
MEIRPAHSAHEGMQLNREQNQSKGKTRAKEKPGNPNTRLRSETAQGENQRGHNKDEKIGFFIAIQSTIIIELWMSPSSLLYLIIGMEIRFLAHSLQLENGNENVRSGKEPYPSTVLFIGPSKRLKDYYAPIA